MFLNFTTDYGNKSFSCRVFRNWTVRERKNFLCNTLSKSLDNELYLRIKPIEIKTITWNKIHIPIDQDYHLQTTTLKELRNRPLRQRDIFGCHTWSPTVMESEPLPVRKSTVAYNTCSKIQGNIGIFIDSQAAILSLHFYHNTFPLVGQYRDEINSLSHLAVIKP